MKESNLEVEESRNILINNKLSGARKQIDSIFFHLIAGKVCYRRILNQDYRGRYLMSKISKMRKTNKRFNFWYTGEDQE